MRFKQFIIFTLFASSALFLGLQYFNFETAAAGLRALVIVLFSVLYYFKVTKKQLFFFLFLTVFATAELFNFASYFVGVEFDVNGFYSYYVVNGLYILAYMFLLIRIFLEFPMIKVIKKFPYHFIVLTILNLYCISNITDTAAAQLTRNEYLFELVYNAVIMVLLSTAVMNFVYKDDRKSMNLLLGSIFIVFAEFIQLTYFYILKVSILNFICSLFLLLGFLFFYLQAIVPIQKKRKRSLEDLLA